MATDVNLTVYDKGPGIAASVIMLVLIDELVAKGTLSPQDKDRVLVAADAVIQGWGNIRSATDARNVIKHMRGLGS